MKISRSIVFTILSSVAAYCHFSCNNHSPRLGMEQPGEVKPVQTYGKGIDVSKWQRKIDWEKVKNSGIQYGIARATSGNAYQDHTFVEHWEGMKRNGIKASAYHYFKGKDPVESQVDNIKSVVLGKCNFDISRDILAIDVEETFNKEVSPTEMAVALWDLTAGLKNKIDNVYIYCSPDYWNDNVEWKKYDFSTYPLWVAHWTKEDNPRLPTTWQDKGWRWWQYSSKGKVDGVEGNEKGHVDLDRIKIEGG